MAGFSTRFSRAPEGRRRSGNPEGSGRISSLAMRGSGGGECARPAPRSFPEVRNRNVTTVGGDATFNICIFAHRASGDSFLLALIVFQQMFAERWSLSCCSWKLFDDFIPYFYCVRRKARWNFESRITSLVYPRILPFPRLGLLVYIHLGPIIHFFTFQQQMETRSE